MTNPFRPASVNPSVLPRDTDVLCIPAHPAIGAHGDALEFRRLSTGDVVAIAFSSPGRLAAQLGEYQPWIALPAIAFSGLVQAAGVQRVLVDPDLDPGISRWEESHITEVLRGEQR